MTFPLYLKDAFDYPTAMALATALGFFFGFVLERAGFGRANVLAAQFYGRNMRVLKVMFSAIVTATVGLGILGGVGVVDLGALKIPETYYGPQIVGGLLLGAGFIISGYCPGTAVVAGASGNTDGFVSLFGVMLGALGFAALYPLLAGFYGSGHAGLYTLPELFGAPWAVVAFGVVGMAIGAFAFAEWVERWLAKRAGARPPASPARTRHAVYAGFVGAGAAGVLALFVPSLTPAAEAPEPVRATDISALGLARQLVEDPTAVFVVDLRAPEACEEDRLPHAMCRPAGEDGRAMFGRLPTTRALVVYDADGTAPLPPEIAAFPGAVQRVTGGHRAFTAEILTPPTAPEVATPDALADFWLKEALHSRFTGKTVQRSEPVAPPKAVKRKVKKGGGC